MKKPLAGLSVCELEDILASFNEPKYRAKQLLEWITRGAKIKDMSNLPLSLRQKLSDEYETLALIIEKEFIDSENSVKKYLYKAEDGIIFEGVVLRYEHGDTLCVSTQAGCRMSCSFCASGKNGLLRNLSRAEMLSQPIIANAGGDKISNIVLMGSGEPLDNYDEVKAFIKALIDENGLNMSVRSITLSTCGIIAGIEKMIEDKLFVNLSISMHAPVSEIRKKLMPIEKAYPIQKVVKTAETFRKASSRRITYEYCVIEGVNDTNECVSALKGLMKGSDSLLNLIDVNEGGGVYAKNKKGVLERFSAKLTKAGLRHTIRRRLGSGVNAGCGQLVSYYLRQTGNKEDLCSR